MNRGEKNVCFILVLMFVLWFLPAFMNVRALDIWMVPALAILLLFILPVNASKGEMTLTSKDFQDGVAWNLLFLVVGGTAMAGALVKLGITDWFGGIVKSGVSAAALPWFAGVITQVLSTVTSGGVASTTIVSTILFPIAKELHYNPAVLARVISGNALAVTFPWAGAASASTFASGYLTLGRMFKVGLVATILTVIVITAVSMIVVPALGAYTAP
jgi:sodium-dependent dicarboxylate transporter 2/3/5